MNVFQCSTLLYFYLFIYLFFYGKFYVLGIKRALLVVFLYCMTETRKKNQKNYYSMEWTKFLTEFAKIPFFILLN